MTIKAKHYDTILAPVFSEKATIANEQSKFIFKVLDTATKEEIKEAISALFAVEAVKVNVLNTKAKRKVFKGRLGKTKSYKKAIVTLAKGQTIDLGIEA